MWLATLWIPSRESSSRYSHGLILSVLSILFFLAAPVAVLLLCKRAKWLGKVGPVLTLYVVGNLVHFEGLAKVQDLLSIAIVSLSILLFLFGCRFHKGGTRFQVLALDADTVTISSVSFICSPPFVPMMSAVMKNCRVLVPGLSIGVVGYALGNYLRFLIFQLLELL